MKTEVKAERISKSAQFIVSESIEKVFPLFGPIEEVKWAHGWDPEVIYSENGKIEEGFIFRTTGH